MKHEAGHTRGGWGRGVARCRESLYMSPGVYDDVSKGCFSSQSP